MVIIENMDMPKRCEDCRFYDKIFGGCELTHFFTSRHKEQEKPDWCPIKEVENDQTGR